MKPLKERIRGILEEHIHEDLRKEDGEVYIADFDIDQALQAILTEIKGSLPEKKQGIKFHSGRQNSELSAYSPKDNQKIGYNAYHDEVERMLNV